MEAKNKNFIVEGKRLSDWTYQECIDMLECLMFLDDRAYDYIEPLMLNRIVEHDRVADYENYIKKQIEINNICIETGLLLDQPKSKRKILRLADQERRLFYFPMLSRLKQEVEAEIKWLEHYRNNGELEDLKDFLISEANAKSKLEEENDLLNAYAKIGEFEEFEPINSDYNPIIFESELSNSNVVFPFENPLIFDVEFLKRMHREFDGVYWDPKDIRAFENCFRVVPTDKFTLKKGVTKTAFCYIFGKLDKHKNKNISSLGVWMNNYGITPKNFDKLKNQWEKNVTETKGLREEIDILIKNVTVKL